VRAGKREGGERKRERRERREMVVDIEYDIE
jgi:hypothetical protein